MWCGSSAISRVGRRLAASRCVSGPAAIVWYVTATPWKSADSGPSELGLFGSRSMP
jgi:hypothetical protein